jgi:hypothetical protein
MLGTAHEQRAVECVYESLVTMDFYSEVLPSAPHVLAVLSVGESVPARSASHPHGSLAVAELQRTGGAGG